MASWSQNGYVILLASALIPPLGLALLWLRRGWGLVRKSLLTVVVLLLTVGHLVTFWGMRFQMGGSGMRPIAYFPAKEKHYAEIERREAEERKAPEPQKAPEAVKTVVAPRPMYAPWPAYFGAARDGRYREGPILTNWPAKGLVQVWRRPVGGGYASMIVAENKVFTIEQRRDQEVLAAYDFDTGREAWTASWKGEFKETMGGDGPRATPTYDEGRVYVLGAEGEFRCVEAATGKVLWSKNILTDNGAANLPWGMAASPLVVDDKVVVMPGGANSKSIVGYNKLTGARVWSALDDKASYTAPMMADFGGVRQILVVTGTRAVGLTIDKGELLWEFPWTNMYDTTSAQPVVAGVDRFIVSGGYDHGAALVEVKKIGDKYEAKQVWFSKSMKNRFNSSVLKDGVVYGIDEGILAAMDAATGQRKWKGGRYGYGQLLLAGDHLVVLSESGEVVLVKASPDRHEEVAKFDALSGKTWNVPALAQGRLLVRNATEMACYRISP